MGKFAHKIRLLRDAEAFARILGTCEKNRFAKETDAKRCLKRAEYECDDRGLCAKHAREFAKAYRLTFPGETVKPRGSAKQVLERVATPRRGKRPRGEWQPQRIDPRFVYVPDTLEKVVTYYSIDLQKYVTAKAGVEVLGEVLAKYLRKQPGKRAVIAGWELWLVKRRTIRMRVARPSEIDPASLFDAWEVRSRMQGSDVEKVDEVVKQNWFRRRRRKRR